MRVTCACYGCSSEHLSGTDQTARSQPLPARCRRAGPRRHSRCGFGRGSRPVRTAPSRAWQALLGRFELPPRVGSRQHELNLPDSESPLSESPSYTPTRVRVRFRCLNARSPHRLSLVSTPTPPLNSLRLIPPSDRLRTRQLPVDENRPAAQASRSDSHAARRAEWRCEVPGSASRNLRDSAGDSVVSQIRTHLGRPAPHPTALPVKSLPYSSQCPPSGPEQSAARATSTDAHPIRPVRPQPTPIRSGPQHAGIDPHMLPQSRPAEPWQRPSRTARRARRRQSLNSAGDFRACRIRPVSVRPCAGPWTRIAVLMSKQEVMRRAYCAIASCHSHATLQHAASTADAPRALSTSQEQIAIFNQRSRRRSVGTIVKHSPPPGGGGARDLTRQRRHHPRRRPSRSPQHTPPLRRRRRRGRPVRRHRRAAAAAWRA
jgi:hypothetical protein